MKCSMFLHIIFLSFLNIMTYIKQNIFSPDTVVTDQGNLLLGTTLFFCYN